MRFNKLDLNLLVALDALLTERNITRAAERLHLSQSATSNALSRLRAFFSDELLVQVGRRMELTPRAASLQEPVRDVLVRVDATISTPPAFDPTAADRDFTIYASDYSLQTVIPQMLALAHGQGSRVRFRLRQQVASPHRALERGEVDLLLIPKAYCSPEHPMETLFEERFLCALWRDSQLARSPLTLARYTEAGHVVMRPAEHLPPAFEDLIVQRAGLARRVEVSTFSFAAMPFLVVGTELIATVHARVARRQAPVLPIVLRPVPFEVPPFGQSMQWHKYRAQDPAMVWLRQLMRDAAKAMDAPDSIMNAGIELGTPTLA